MRNLLYSYLVNASAASLAGLIGSDLVASDFVPKRRHPVVEQVAEVLFGESLQSAQFWICRARQIIRSTPLNDYVSILYREAGYRIDDLASELQRYRQPIITTPGGQQVSLPSFGVLQRETYELSEFRLELDDDLVTVRTSGGLTVLTAELASDQTSLLLFPEQEAGCWVSRDQLPGSIVWASRPRANVSLRYEEQRHYLAPLISSMISLPSCFDETTRRSLADHADLTVQQPTAFGAVALLVAGHTASLYGDSLI